MDAIIVPGTDNPTSQVFPRSEGTARCCQSCQPCQTYMIVTVINTSDSRKIDLCERAWQICRQLLLLSTFWTFVGRTKNCSFVCSTNSMWVCSTGRLHKAETLKAQCLQNTSIVAPAKPVHMVPYHTNLIQIPPKRTLKVWPVCGPQQPLNHWDSVECTWELWARKPSQNSPVAKEVNHSNLVPGASLVYFNKFGCG